jgi:hypothetical protein
LTNETGESAKIEVGQGDKMPLRTITRDDSAECCLQMLDQMLKGSKLALTFEVATSRTNEGIISTSTEDWVRLIPSLKSDK